MNAPRLALGSALLVAVAAAGLACTVRETVVSPYDDVVVAENAGSGKTSVLESVEVNEGDGGGVFTKAPRGTSDEPGGDAGAIDGGRDGRSLDAGVLGDGGGAPGASCAAFFDDQQESEANDVVNAADLLDDLMCGTIGTPTDVDWYVLDAPFGIELTFTPDADALAAVWAPSGAMAAAQTATVFTSAERGRFLVRVTSPSRTLQRYLLVPR